MQKTWREEEEEEEDDEEGGSADVDMESESCFRHHSCTLSAHYLVISRPVVLKRGGINQLSRVNVLRPRTEPWVAL